MSKPRKQIGNDSVTKTYPLPTDKFYFRNACLNARADREELLSDSLNRKGQYQALRKLALKIMPAEWVAQMQDEDLCDAMQVLYAYYGKEDEGDTIILVDRSKLQEYKAARQQYEILLKR